MYAGVNEGTIAGYTYLFYTQVRYFEKTMCLAAKLISAEVVTRQAFGPASSRTVGARCFMRLLNPFCNTCRAGIGNTIKSTVQGHGCHPCCSGPDLDSILIQVLGNDLNQIRAPASVPNTKPASGVSSVAHSSMCWRCARISLFIPSTFHVEGSKFRDGQDLHGVLWRLPGHHLRSSTKFVATAMLAKAIDLVLPDLKIS